MALLDSPSATMIWTCGFLSHSFSSFFTLSSFQNSSQIGSGQIFVLILAGGFDKDHLEFSRVLFGESHPKRKSCATAWSALKRSRVSVKRPRAGPPHDRFWQPWISSYPYRGPCSLDSGLESCVCRSIVEMSTRYRSCRSSEQPSR